MINEELRMVLDTIKDVAQTAGYAGVVWIVIHYLTQLVGAIIWPVMGCVAIVKIVNAWRTKISQPDGNALEKTKQVQLEATQNKHVFQLEAIAKAAGVGPLRIYDALPSTDVDTIKRLIKKGLEAKP